MSSVKSAGASTTTPGTPGSSTTNASVAVANDVAATTAVTDQAVLEYLKSKGMSNAVLELTEKLKTEPKKESGSEVTPAGATPTPERLGQLREQLETEDEVARSQRTTLSKVTGGGFGYDLDAAVPIAQWGVPDKPLPDDPNEKDPTKQPRRQLGLAEAKAYLDAFCALQVWVLSLPEDTNGGWQPQTENVVAKAYAVLTANGNKSKTNDSSAPDAAAAAESAAASTTTSGEEQKNDNNTNDEKKESDSSTRKAMLSNVISELIKPAAPLDNSESYPIPISAKPELLSVSFALLVHTYCELLEVGMESTAHVLRDAFKPVYDPIYGEQYKDLYQCTTTEEIVKLNTHNSQHMEALQNLRQILLQIAQIQSKAEELSNANFTDQARIQARSKKLQEYNQTIGLLQQRHTELSQRASTAFERMHDMPFLRRARAVRWQITMSNTTYAMLCQFLSSAGAGVDDTSMLAMSTLLQCKCELHIERRDPLPFTPAVVLDDNALASMSTTSRERYKYLNQDTPVQWAAPVARSSRTGEKDDRPFPKFHLEQEYDDERSARRGKRIVEFNRAIVVNGFRRLEALERKRDYEVMSKTRDTKPTTRASTDGEEAVEVDLKRIPAANPLEPSILLSTLCANQVRKRDSLTKTSKNRGRSGSMGGATDRTATSSKTGAAGPAHFSEFAWEESGIGIACAKLCQPDGRKVAIGCDDAGIRVWNLLEDLPKDNGTTQSMAGDAGQILLGHKNGFPVFDVSWNRDGRCLLSAGGDGSIRLWDTDAQGTFGEVIPSSSIKGSTGAAKGTLATMSTTKKGTVSSAAAKEAMNKANANVEKARRQPDMSVPGLKPETRRYTSGAALAVYRGHAPNTPIWSVSWAPCGYYFASAGSDATARLWTTDRPVPVRLFTGHTSNSVHSVVFHPNCNYVLTGGEDKTVRLWDVQTGRCVRLLNGCPAGIHKVEIDPSGQYAVGADLLGTVHLWDLATGKKMTELRGVKPIVRATPSGNGLQRTPVSMLHCLAFSACGTALATGGDDRCVRIWDIRKVTTNPFPVMGIPHKSFNTRRTMILDLQYSKRNLLMGVGKYISGITAINTISD
ncbi:WD repeat-containing protein [Nitzschia inconspicua]|uniref:WD repeat-containing protein n=1 Tax=Nitzschia inconspicua TaxID=303405 RepID=A0A9K3PRN1_9STRA|nr:WD repeat-containing protein [Nitzschia inconspicua]